MAAVIDYFVFCLVFMLSLFLNSKVIIFANQIQISFKIVTVAALTKETLNDNKEDVNITPSDTKAWTSALK